MENLDMQVLLTHMIEDEGVAVIKSDSFSSLPARIPASGTNSAIKSSHVVINQVLSNPSAQTSDWTVTTYDGYLEISGSISGSTDITLYLAELNGSGRSGVTRVTFTGVSSFANPFTDNSIKSSHACIKAELSNPSAQTSDWTVKTYDGYLNIEGTISGTTDITLYLVPEVA